MKKSAYIKTAFIAVLFLSPYSRASETLVESIRCLIRGDDRILIIDNSQPSYILLNTNKKSQITQNISSGRTTLIFNVEQFPLTLEIQPKNIIWKIFNDCTNTSKK